MRFVVDRLATKNLEKKIDILIAEDDFVIKSESKEVVDIWHDAWESGIDSYDDVSKYYNSNDRDFLGALAAKLFWNGYILRSEYKSLDELSEIKILELGGPGSGIKGHRTIRDTGGKENGKGDLGKSESTSKAAKLPAPKTKFKNITPPPPSYLAGVKSRAEMDAVEVYTYPKMPKYLAINSALRSGGTMSKEVVPLGVVAHLDAVTNRQVLGVDGYLYRGMSKDFISKLGIGSVYSDKGFVSTSLKPGIARVFTYGQTKTVVRIKATANTKGLYIGGVQREFLLPRDRKFRVVGKTEEKGHSFLDVEIL